MKSKIKRLSPHQNGKVAGIIMAITTLPMILLMSIPITIVSMVADFPESSGFPFGMLIIFPILYFVFTYIAVAFACWLYNVLFEFIGGFEFEFDQSE